ncbi:DUF4159 domain-containing protein [Spirochaetota bacterium]
MAKKIIFILIIIIVWCAGAEVFDFEFAVMKYSGGGDWYEGLVGAKELMHYINRNTDIYCRVEPVTVEAGSSDIYYYPFLYMTGHGDVKFTDDERENIRNYLTSGGFLYANDDYGMDKSFRREVKLMFPKTELVEVPVTHGIFHSYYDFPGGLPKIHKHDGGEPKAFGIFYNKRLILFYSFNTDIGDGWAPYQVHKDPEDVRIEALKMGLNIIVHSMIQ